NERLECAEFFRLLQQVGNGGFPHLLGQEVERFSGSFGRAFYFTIFPYPPPPPPRHQLGRTPRGVAPPCERPGERQQVAARQRRERQLGQRPRVDPDDLLYLRPSRDRALDVDRIDRGAHQDAGLVRRRRIEHAERPRAARGDAAAELLVDLAHQRRHVALPGIALAAGLHEGRRAALAHQKHPAALVPPAPPHHP